MITRRTFIERGAALVPLVPFLSNPLLARTTAGQGDGDALIRALLPRDPSGHQFAMYSDSTSGRPDAPNIAVFARLNRVMRRLSPEPEFIAFPGDAVGSGNNVPEWEHFLNTEMRPITERKIPVFFSTSNHDTHTWAAEDNFRKYHPEIPQNGPDDQKGLAYYLRRGNLLYVSLHHPAPNGDYRKGFDFGDTRWLERVLADNADAEYKLVAAHYPIWRVNGYTTMSIPQKDWRKVWDVFKQHKVTAYLTSHVLAYDVQVMDGILQICSGAAVLTERKTGYPDRTEFVHLTQLAMDRQGLRVQALDIVGIVRETLAWPFPVPSSASWTALADAMPPYVAPDAPRPGAAIHLMRIWDLSYFPLPFVSRLDLLKGTRGGQDVFTVWLDLPSMRLNVTLSIDNEGEQHWLGPVYDPRAGRLDVQLAFHPGMGPGGLMWRWNDDAPWSSMESVSARGLEAFAWPDGIRLVKQDLQYSKISSRPLTFSASHATVPVPSVDSAP